jgi:hypothetical protein
MGHARSTRASMLRSSVPLGAMDCRVKPGNDDGEQLGDHYFFAGAAGLSADGSAAGGG